MSVDSIARCWIIIYLFIWIFIVICLSWDYRSVDYDLIWFLFFFYINFYPISVGHILSNSLARFFLANCFIYSEVKKWDQKSIKHWSDGPFKSKWKKNGTKKELIWKKDEKETKWTTAMLYVVFFRFPRFFFFFVRRLVPMYNVWWLWRFICIDENVKRRN